jgi:hypothetical protein
VKQDYTMACLRDCAGLRPSVPNPSAHPRVLPVGTTKPLTAHPASRRRHPDECLMFRTIKTERYGNKPNPRSTGSHVES